MGNLKCVYARNFSTCARTQTHQRRGHIEEPFKLQARVTRVQIFVIEENINLSKNKFLKGLTGERTVINVTELDIPAILGERCLDATVLVVIGVDVGVGCTGVALNEKEKLLEQHVGVLTGVDTAVAAFENC